MNILEVMENYSRLCDELDAFMQEQNRELRGREPNAAGLAATESLLARLTDALAGLRAAESAEGAHRGMAVEARARVLQKLLKLLLLSRESERLLLANATPVRKAVPPRASAPRLHMAYRAHSM